MRIGIIAKTNQPEFAPLFQEVVRWLEERDCSLVLEDRVVEVFGLKGRRGVPRGQIPAQVDVLVVFGGDGTMLSAARLAQGHRAPILGVNLGSMGFLTEVPVSNLYPALERLLKGEQKVERRRLLQVKLEREGGERETYQALNDAVIAKGTLARIITVSAFVNEAFVADFHADGLIVATPTGSTAYSLSAGGPIVFPTLECLLITPICPHTLTNRPLVIPARNRIRLVLRSGEDVMLTVDGQVGRPLQEGDELVCSASRNCIGLIQNDEKSFFDVLREKLRWGERSASPESSRFPKGRSPKLKPRP